MKELPQTIQRYLCSQSDVDFLHLIRWMSFILIAVLLVDWQMIHQLQFMPWFLVVLACAIPRVVNWWWLWVGMWLFSTIEIFYFGWMVIANHTWVMWYWTIAVICSFVPRHATHALQVLQANARGMLIVVMLVAVFWKVINPHYMDGTFFERNLIANPNFALFTHTFTAMPWETLQTNTAIGLESLGLPIEGEFELTTSPWITLFSHITTWWVLLIELIIGILLLFRKKITDWWSHVLHLQFIIFAYMATPIIGFGWTLLVLGYSLTQEFGPRMRYAYLAVMFLMFLYGLPKETILIDILGVYPLW